MGVYGSFTGAVMAIQDFWREASEPAGCVKHMTLADGSGNTVNFLVMPDTYFVDHGMVSLGDTVTGFYDTTVPVPMIYPPQYVAAVMAKMIPGRLVTVDYFGRDLVSSDGNLKLNIGPNTVVMLKNGQAFSGRPVGRDLTVLYGPTTRSIPAQTTPYQIIVMCPAVQHGR
jgi:hypothetical protein